ncbi:ArsR family transcriptional regulator [Streptomyces sp. NBC_01006]|uniref:ArsR/SmtB family transcription factor n=1 Tax=Streptomyces sp. NBC_01006 TaxID=2903716 RepID=UPI003866FCB7|nr:winged helix-turn-helix domain-containing protein [Streptomyces sp. NBC_01006]
MGEVRFGVHDVAGVRFAISPLWETVVSFSAVADPGRHAVHLPWIAAVRPLWEDRALARRTAPLRALVSADPLRPDPPGFLTPPPRCPLAEFEEELAILMAAAAPEPGADLPGLGEALRAWWEAAVRPYWPRIRAVLEADIAYRTRQLAEDGIQEVLARLHPTLRWSGDRLDSPDLAPAVLDLDGKGLTLAPSAFALRCRLLTGPGPVPPAVVYPSRAVGTLWERRAASGEGLARLLGRSRARLLAFTTSPATTTQLAARTGLSLGAVSQHLAVLRDAGLVTSHRYRREVHYATSELGGALLERAQGCSAGPVSWP